MSSAGHNLEFPTPTPQERLLAEQSYQRLFAHTHDKKMAPLKVIADDQDEITIPPKAVALLMDILEEMAAGHPVTITTVHTELTTQEAADLLNVSRPYLVVLLEKNKIPHRKVGTKRRIRTEDILSYKEALEAQRLAVLDELANQAQTLKMGY